jgi:hypothetical protein
MNLKKWKEMKRKDKKEGHRKKRKVGKGREQCCDLSPGHVAIRFLSDIVLYTIARQVN